MTDDLRQRIADLEAERDEGRAALDRVRALHIPEEHLGRTWCYECSTRTQTSMRTERWDVFIPYPCPTLNAIDGIGGPAGHRCTRCGKTGPAGLHLSCGG